MSHDNAVKDAADWLIQASRYQRTVKAFLNIRDISGKTHLEVGFVMYERDSDVF